MDDSRKILLRDRLLRIEERIAAACARAGRRRDEVTLVAVTKTVPIAVAALVAEMGVRHLGESRPQELWRKAAALDQSLFWHLIGHLQRNKIERTAPLVCLIHSVDSLRLLDALEQEAGKRGRRLHLLLEVNASREASKHGFTPEEAAELAPRIAALGSARVCGLMTMAPFQEDPERCRPTFVALRELRDRLQGELGPTPRLEHLSMGMSNDFEVAIEEGATLVRIGTALFEGLEEQGSEVP
jgi:pyridoxal phosphate enzyme (YggS family)